MDHHNFFIYSHFDFSRKSAGATRMLYYARALADGSNKVYLTSCCKTTIKDADFEEVEPNIFVLEKKILTKNFFSILGFLRNLYSFSDQKQGAKIFIFYPFPLVSLEILSLLYLKLYKKQPLYTELNEVRKHTSAFHAPLTIKNPTYSIKKIVFKSTFTIMEPLLYFYDGLICISTAIEKYGQAYNKNTIRVPILTDPYKKTDKSDQVYSTKNVFNIGFSGSIHPSKENLLNFMEVLGQVNESGRPISFNVCGPIKEQHHKLLFKDNPSGKFATYYGNLNEVEMSTFLSQQDLLVIPRGYSLQNNYGFSTKLSDYLNHEKLILLTNIGDNKIYIKDGINGFIVPPDNNGEMYKKLIYIIDNFESLKQTIIPNASKTSKEEFYYINHRKRLFKFLTTNENE